jgi:hypothetical protein
VPGAIANSVGLTAATTVPSAATSRTKCPRLTPAMRRRSREIIWPVVSQPWISQANSSTSSAAPPAAIHDRRRVQGDGDAASGVSWAWVPRMPAVSETFSGILRSCASFMASLAARRVPESAAPQRADPKRLYVLGIFRGTRTQDARSRAHQRCPPAPGGQVADSRGHSGVVRRSASGSCAPARCGRKVSLIEKALAKEEPMATRRTDEIPATANTRARGAQPKGTRTAKAKSPQRAAVSGDDRHAMIAEAAYLRAERRGFAPGQETEDWLAAEVEVDALLKIGHGGPAQ